jgi:hypothetical protein
VAAAVAARCRTVPARRVSGTLQNGGMALIQTICKNLQHDDYPEPGLTLYPRS